ncbi:hypothetical protein CJF30_00006196 [Rutstroemia sp. NJR-2017a BBW]|nr:hypothetical protein CJF30_00006196 [Rutstroemia sp. NJR-2017a BBW]
MRFPTLWATAALSASSHAFLLPPSISNADAAIEADGRLMSIDCPGCPITIGDLRGGLHDVQGPSKLLLNFSISHDGNKDHLNLNGLRFYPIDVGSEPPMEPLTAPQLIKTPGTAWAEAADPELGFALRVAHAVPYSKEDEINLITVVFDVIEVGKTFVTGVPSVELKLLETPSGKLMIGDSQIIPAKSQSASPTDNIQECTTPLCKWRAILADRLSKLKGFTGCGGKARPASEKPHHHGSHGGDGRPHRFHHKHHGFARFLRGIVLHIFVPVVIGIVAGITASVVGMLVGNLIVFVWRLLFRRNAPGYAKVQQEDCAVEEGIEEDKSLIQHQGPPPVYEDVVKEDTERQE